MPRTPRAWTAQRTSRPRARPGLTTDEHVALGEPELDGIAVLVDAERDRIPQRELNGGGVRPAQRVGAVERVATDECDRGESSICRAAGDPDLSDVQASSELLRASFELGDRRAPRHPDPEQLADSDRCDRERARSLERTLGGPGVNDSAIPRASHTRTTEHTDDPTADRPHRQQSRERGHHDGTGGRIAQLTRQQRLCAGYAAKQGELDPAPPRHSSEVERERLPFRLRLATSTLPSAVRAVRSHPLLRPPLGDDLSGRRLLRLSLRSGARRDAVGLDLAGAEGDS